MKNKTRIFALLLVVLTLFTGVLGAAVAYAAEADNGAAAVSDADYGIATVAASETCYKCGGSVSNGFCTTTSCGGYMAAVQNSSGYYEIGNGGQLYWFAALVNGALTGGTAKNTSANAVLTADITVNTGVLNSSGGLNSGSFRTWTPIGSNSDRYAGNFDGNGKTVSGLYIKEVNTSRLALVAYLAAAGTVENVGVIGSCFDGYAFNGGLVSTNYGTIDNCYNASYIGARGTYVGGIVGDNYGTVTNCYNTGTVASTSQHVGGIAGCNESDGTILNCYNTGSVTTTHASCTTCGSIVGWAYYDNDVANCYYLGSSGTSVGTSKTSAQFASGEVAWLLNGSSSNGAWKQTIGSDAAPNFTGKTVYTKYCNGSDTSTGYSNAMPIHIESLGYDANGFCANGCYEPATDSDSDGYYEIYNGGNLFWFAHQVNAGNVSYKGMLMNDIDLEGNKGRIWTPIGLATKDGENVITTAVYTGTFDGNYHRIKNMTTDKTKCFQGLFGVVNGATIREVIIDSSCTVQGTYFVGGVVAGTVGTSKVNIESCGNEADVTAYGDVTATVANDQLGYNAAGILGVNWQSNIYVYIKNCYNSGDIYGDKENGAISGWLGRTYDVINCLNTGTVTGADTNRPFARAESYYTSWFKNNYSTAIGLQESYITKVTSAQLESGEVAYKLNGSASGGSPWKQTLGTDATPNFEGGTVYYPYTLCSGVKLYTNDSAKNGVTEAHDFTDNGFCQNHGCYEPAKLVSAATSTTNAVYEISNAGQMFWFAALVNGDLTGVDKTSAVDAYLAADIDLEGREWKPIAADHEYRDTGATRTTVFNGVFDGKGRRIYNLNIQANDNNSALFGVVYASTIKNFTLEGTITINAVNANNIASVVGFMGDSRVTGITSYVNIAFSDTADIVLEDNDNLNYTRYIGGIVGKISCEGNTSNHGGTISNCAYYGTIDIGEKYVDLVGGIIAYIWRDGGYGAVNDCGFYGTIVSDYKGNFTTNAGENKATVCIGGILGYSNHTGTKMTDCLVVGSSTLTE